MNNEKLRQEVKLLKALQGITYREIAEEYLGMRTHSFYNWIRGEYDLGEEKSVLLAQIIETLKEG